MRYGTREFLNLSCGCDSYSDCKCYTQESQYGDQARSHEELKQAKLRKPSLNEGLAIREKINCRYK